MKLLSEQELKFVNGASGELEHANGVIGAMIGGGFGFIGGGAISTMYANSARFESVLADAVTGKWGIFNNTYTVVGTGLASFGGALLGYHLFYKLAQTASNAV